MNKEVIHTQNAPDAVGPYSQAIRSGDLLFCSGQVALDQSSGDLDARLDWSATPPLGHPTD